MIQKLNKPKFIKDKSFYKMVFAIVLPITMQNIITLVTQMLDTIMLGELGDVAMSASSLANQPFFIFNMFVFGLSSGASVMTAQYWGKKDTKSIKTIFTMAIKVSVLVGFILNIVILIFPEQIMAIYIQDTEVIKAGAEYLRVMAYSYMFFGFASTVYVLLRSVEAVKVGVVSNIAVLLINGSLNYVLIFGNFGAPKLGVKGAAIATLAARIVEFIVAFIYLMFVDKRLNMKFKDFLSKNKMLLQDMIKISTPVLINELMWGLGTSMQALVLGHLGKEAVAANSIIGVIQQLATVAVFGVAGAAAVLIGKAIGEGNMQEAYNRGHTFKIISIIVGVIVSVIILLLKNVAIDFYNVTPEARDLAHQMIYVTVFVGFFVSMSATGIVGILRGGGDTKFSLNIEIISLWGIAVPLALLSAFVLKWNPVWVFAIMKIDEPIKNILWLMRTRGTKWLKDVTR